jgi:hypothetical protein
MSYARRRYKVVDGVLKTDWTGRDDEGWVKSKADALKAAEPVPMPSKEVMEDAPEGNSAGDAVKPAGKSGKKPLWKRSKT